MVREKHDVLVLLPVPDDDSPQLVRILGRRCVPTQENALVGDDVSFPPGRDPGRMRGTSVETATT